MIRKNVGISISGGVFSGEQIVVGNKARATFTTAENRDDSHAVDPSKPARERPRIILFLAANPRDTDRIRLDEEIKIIEQALERASRREDYKLVPKWAVTVDDLRRALLEEKPEIVHFSGHGIGAGGPSRGRDLVPAQGRETEGLAFENEEGGVQLTSGDALGRLFHLCADNVKCVVLNACYSDFQAEAIAKSIDYVMGMTKPISDQAAIKFALGLYEALGAGEEFERAFQSGCLAIDLTGSPEWQTPRLRRKS